MLTNPTCVNKMGVFLAATVLCFALQPAFAAVTLNENTTSITRERTGQTSGSETIFRTDPQRTTVIEVSPESAGSATINASMNTQTPTSFTGFSADTAGATSTTKMVNLGMGITFVGLSVSSGTWTTRVYNK